MEIELYMCSVPCVPSEPVNARVRAEPEIEKSISKLASSNFSCLEYLG